MVTKACIFIDGENFRHSIINLFQEFNKDEYLPVGDWSRFFDWLVERICSQDSIRVRTYWYVIGQVDFFPYRYPYADTEPEKLKKILAGRESFKAELEKLSGIDLEMKMRDYISILESRKGTIQARVEGWTKKQRTISYKHHSIEFRRAGSITYNLLSDSFNIEKSVDVMLAIDLFRLKDIYDLAIIVSGDQDYVPAVQAIKDCGKKVVNVAFKTSNGKLLPGGAWRLNEITDWRFEVEHDEFKNFLNL